jgi:hypothetical protein
MAGFALEGGALGGILGSFGPWGVAAAASIGLVSAAFDYLNEHAAKFGEASIQINKVGQATGLTTTEVRGLSEAAEKAGVSGDEIGSSFERLTANLATAREGTGTLFTSLEKVNGQLAVDVAGAKSGAEAWDLIAKAVTGTGNAFDKAAIAKAAFGKGGVVDVPVLQATDAAGGLAAYSEEVQKATGITDQLTQRVAGLKAEIEATKKQTENVYASLYSVEVLTRQAEFAKVQFSVSQSFAAMVKAAGGFHWSDFLPSESDPGVTDLEARARAAPSGDGQAASPAAAGSSDKIKEQANETQRLTTVTTSLAAAQANAEKALQAYDSEGVTSTTTIEALTASRKNAGDALLLLSNLEKAHITTLNGAATGEEILKAKTDALTAAFNQGKITAEDYNRALHGDTNNVVAGLQDQRSVIEAIGGAAKMAAQYAADYAAQLRAGKDPADALAIASEKLANAQAAANASAQAQTWTLQNNLAVAQAWTASGQMLAQQQATYNQLVHDGVDSETAGATAAAQYADAKARAVAAGEKLVQSSQDNLDKITAQGTGMEGVVASSIAYRDAIQAGATATQAAAISADTLQASMVQAAQAADRVAQSEAAAALSAATAKSKGNPFTTTNLDPWNVQDQPTGSSLPLIQTAKGLYPANDARGFAIAFQQQNGTLNPPPDLNQIANSYVSRGDYAGALTDTERLGANSMSTVDTLVQNQNGMTSDKGIQTSNLQAEMAWLNTLPETIARDQKLVSLQQSIDQLTSATTANTAATLNPLYTQGAGALAIGYYHAANGFDGVAQGPTSGDQVPFHAMVNGGERIQITPAGQSGTKQSGSGGQPVVIQNFDFRGTQSNSRRSARQAAQGFGQTAAAMR